MWKGLKNPESRATWGASSPPCTLCSTHAWPSMEQWILHCGVCCGLHRASIYAMGCSVAIYRAAMKSVSSSRESEREVTYKSQRRHQWTDTDLPFLDHPLKSCDLACNMWATFFIFLLKNRHWENTNTLQIPPNKGFGDTLFLGCPLSSFESANNIWNKHSHLSTFRNGQTECA